MALPTDSPKPTSFVILSSPQSNFSFSNKTLGTVFFCAFPSVPFCSACFLVISAFCSSTFFNASPIPYLSAYCLKLNALSKRFSIFFCSDFVTFVILSKKDLSSAIYPPTLWLLEQIDCL